MSARRGMAVAALDGEANLDRTEEARLEVAWVLGIPIGLLGGQIAGPSDFLVGFAPGVRDWMYYGRFEEGA